MSKNKSFLKIYGIKASECETWPYRFIKNNYLDQKNWDKKAKMGKNLCENMLLPCKLKAPIVILTLGLRLKQGLTKVWVESEAWEWHLMFMGV